MDSNTYDYLNYIVNPSKIATNFSFEKMNIYITIINEKLEKIKNINPENITQDVLNDKIKFENMLTSLYLAYIIKESSILYIPAPDGMGWLLNCNLKP